MTSPSSSRKRKHNQVDAHNTPAASFKLSTNNPSGSSQVGPLLVSFPALEAPESTAFKCYGRKKPKNTTTDAVNATEDTLVVGESESVEFFTSAEETQRMAVDGGCTYLIALHNKRTKITTLHPTPVPLHILTRQVKALKGLASAEKDKPDLDYNDARTALGETFGSKKSKQAIKARERNRVDVDAMEGVAGHLQARIEDSTVGLPTTEEAKANTDSNRLIPPFDASALDPADIYPLHDIIPEAEWKSLSTTALLSAQTDAERMAMFPYKRSSWLRQHLGRMFPKDTDADANGTRSKRSLKLLLYISSMLAFRQACAFQRSIEKERLHEKLAGVPSIVVDSLLARFTETPRGSIVSQSTTQTQTKLLTHIFALCLRIDSYATDTTLVAADLSLDVTKVNQLFKSLGCKISVLNDKERKRLGLPDSAGETKRAVLTAPVVFPKQRLPKRATGRR